MSRTVTCVFDTVAEAVAFRNGVEWVNDSALEFDGEGEATHVGQGDGYVVVFTDEDGYEDEVHDYRAAGRVNEDTPKITEV